MPPFALLLVFVSTILHAGWNLLAHSQRADNRFFLRAAICTGVAGLVPVLWAESSGISPFPTVVWLLLLLTGLFQGFYFLGLTRAYGSGNFTVVYPVARALPVLMLVFVDISRGRYPSPLGWLGIILVAVGCFVSPLESLRSVHWNKYLNITGFWILVTALAGAGYSTVDKIAAEHLAPGAFSAARYGLVETLLTAGYLWALLWLTTGAQKSGAEQSVGRWKMAAGVGVMIFAAYWLILWAFQISLFASYVVALRQFSIVIGVVVATLLFHEPAARLRIGAAVVIAAGVASIALAG